MFALSGICLLAVIGGISKFRMGVEGEELYTALHSRSREQDILYISSASVIPTPHGADSVPLKLEKKRKGVRAAPKRQLIFNGIKDRMEDTAEDAMDFASHTAGDAANSAGDIAEDAVDFIGDAAPDADDWQFVVDSIQEQDTALTSIGSVLNEVLLGDINRTDFKFCPNPDACQVDGFCDILSNGTFISIFEGLDLVDACEKNAFYACGPRVFKHSCERICDSYPFMLPHTAKFCLLCKIANFCERGGTVQLNNFAYATKAESGGNSGASEATNLVVLSLSCIFSAMSTLVVSVLLVMTANPPLM